MKSKSKNIKKDKVFKLYLKKIKGFFIWTWKSDSLLSYIVFLFLSFVFLKFIFFPTLSFIFNTEYPLVVIVSGSMQHKIVNGEICGINNLKNEGYINFETFWKYCGGYYKNFKITKEDFLKYPYHNGLDIGDILILYGKKPKDIKKGDIVVFIPQIKEFYERKGPVIHRVIKKWDENNKIYFQTKGDHNPYSQKGFEDKIPEKNLIGVPILRIPKLGLIKVFLYRIISSII